VYFALAFASNSYGVLNQLNLFYELTETARSLSPRLLICGKIQLRTVFIHIMTYMYIISFSAHLRLL